MTNTQLKGNIDSSISNKTLNSSILPTDVGGQLKSVVDYTDQEVSKISLGVTGPVGPKGDAGPVGPAGLEWKGPWVSGASYIADDAVGYSGASYFCIAATSGTVTPNLDTAKWALLASQGAQGIQGSIGATGNMGLQGLQGLPGIAGTNGNTVLNGTVIPTSGVGVNGDFYINTTTKTIFGPKAAGLWPITGTLLVGPAGPTGATGATGATGPSGGGDSSIEFKAIAEINGTVTAPKWINIFKDNLQINDTDVNNVNYRSVYITRNGTGLYTLRVYFNRTGTGNISGSNKLDVSTSDGKIRFDSSYPGVMVNGNMTTYFLEFKIIDPFTNTLFDPSYMYSNIYVKIW
jgi:hypothetical protein